MIVRSDHLLWSWHKHAILSKDVGGTKPLQILISDIGAKHSASFGMVVETPTPCSIPQTKIAILMKVCIRFVNCKNHQMYEVFKNVSSVNNCWKAFFAKDVVIKIQFLLSSFFLRNARRQMKRAYQCLAIMIDKEFVEHFRPYDWHYLESTSQFFVSFLDKDFLFTQESYLTPLIYGGEMQSFFIL